MTYSKELHNELKRLYEKATDLPWVNMTDDTFFGEIRTAGGEHFTEIADMPHLDDRTADFEYIVTACNNVPALLDELTRLQSVEKAQEWILVSEKLPEPNKRIQFFGGFEQTTHIGYYRDSAEQWESENGGYWHGKNFCLITHWRPLPPHPQERRNDK